VTLTAVNVMLGIALLGGVLLLFNSLASGHRDAKRDLEQLEGRLRSVFDEDFRRLHDEASKTAGKEVGERQERQTQLAAIDDKLKALSVLREQLAPASGARPPLARIQEGIETLRNTELKNLGGTQQQLFDSQRELLLRIEERLGQISGDPGLPPEDQVSDAIVVLDGGEPMVRLSYHSVQAAVAAALASAIRETPKRQIGLVWNRGDRPELLAAFKKHDPAEIDELAKKIKDHRAVPGEDHHWSTGLKEAMDRLAVSPKATLRRVVYITTAPLGQSNEPSNGFDRLLETALRLNVQIWLVHLLGESGQPEAELCRLARGTRGNYLCLFAGPKPGFPLEERLLFELQQALDLSRSKLR
jgi:hypothetical protein